MCSLRRRLLQTRRLIQTQVYININLHAEFHLNLTEACRAETRNRSPTKRLLFNTRRPDITSTSIILRAETFYNSCSTSYYSSSSSISYISIKLTRNVRWAVRSGPTVQIKNTNICCGSSTMAARSVWLNNTFNFNNKLCYKATIWKLGALPLKEGGGAKHSPSSENNE